MATSKVFIDCIPLHENPELFPIVQPLPLYEKRNFQLFIETYIVATDMFVVQCRKMIHTKLDGMDSGNSTTTTLVTTIFLTTDQN